MYNYSIYLTPSFFVIFAIDVFLFLLPGQRFCPVLVTMLLFEAIWQVSRLVNEKHSGSIEFSMCY